MCFNKKIKLIENVIQTQIYQISKKLKFNNLGNYPKFEIKIYHKWKNVNKK